MLLLLTVNALALTTVLTNGNPGYLLEVSSNTIKPDTIYPGDTINIGINLHNQGLYSLLDIKTIAHYFSHKLCVTAFAGEYLKLRQSLINKHRNTVNSLGAGLFCLL